MLALRIPGGGSPASPHTRSTSRAKRGIARVLAHIEVNYAFATSLPKLAELAGIHPSHLCREFKKQVGSSPLEYLQRIRMQRASVLLRGSEKSVKEVGLCVGFKRPEAFSKVFKKLMGCSPRKFRSSGNHRAGPLGGKNHG